MRATWWIQTAASRQSDRLPSLALSVHVTEPILNVALWKIVGRNSGRLESPIGSKEKHASQILRK